jgi:hypothetical protein
MATKQTKLNQRTGKSLAGKPLNRIDWNYQKGAGRGWMHSTLYPQVTLLLEERENEKTYSEMTQRSHEEACNKDGCEGA